MRTLGWIDTSSPEGLAKFKQATSQLSQAKAAPEKLDSADKWKTEVQTFIEVEAARPGGIDYRKDKEAQELFDIYCAICHGNTGDGKGKLVTNEKFLGVPSYKDRVITEGSIFHVITYGLNSMGSHANQLNQDERWLVTAYVQKLKSEL